MATMQEYLEEMARRQATGWTPGVPNRFAIPVSTTWNLPSTARTTMRQAVPKANLGDISAQSNVKSTTKRRGRPKSDAQSISDRQNTGLIKSIAPMLGAISKVAGPAAIAYDALRSDPALADQSAESLAVSQAWQDANPNWEDYMETEVPTATTEPAGFSTATGAGGFTGGSQMFDMGMDPTFANTGGWGVPQNTVSLPEVLGWVAAPPAAKGLVSMGKKGLDWMGPYKGYHDLGSRWDTLGGILDMGQVLGKVVGIPTAIAALGYDALTESPEEFRQSVLEDVETTPFSSTLDAATIGETTTPNQYGGYGIPSAIAVDQQGNPINLNSIDRPSRTGRTVRTDRTGAAISIPGLNPLADAGITAQDQIDAYNAASMGQIASHPGQGGHVGGPTDPDITIPEMLARNQMAMRQDAMPTQSDLAGITQQNVINAQMAQEAAGRQRQQQAAIDAQIAASVMAPRQDAMPAAPAGPTQAEIAAQVAAAEQAHRDQQASARQALKDFMASRAYQQEGESIPAGLIDIATEVDSFATIAEQGGGYQGGYADMGGFEGYR